MNETMEIGVKGGTPTDGNTIELFNSFTAFGGTPLSAVGESGLKRISFGVENDQAGTLESYMSQDGSTWIQFGDDIAVVAAAATDISGPYDFLVDTYRYVRLLWVNGGVTQGTWVPVMHGHSDRQPGT